MPIIITIHRKYWHNHKQTNHPQGGSASQGGHQNSFNNQNAPAQQNQFNKPTQAPAQSKPTAMPDGPVDDDIPF